MILRHRVSEVLQPKAPGPLGGFGRVPIQDGASFSVKDTLHEQYPGRFNKQTPAAVERHVTMSLPEESVEQVTLTADTAAERPHLPSRETRCGDLPLADYGHSDPGHPDAVDRSGGVVRGSKEWKSCANLHAFDTGNAGIAEGWIWMAIAASMLKRYVGQMTRALRGMEISTRKVTMRAHHGLVDVFRVPACGPKG